MSNLAQFSGGYGPIASIVNYFSSGGASTGSINIASAATNGNKETLSGALTANTLATLVSLTGRGRVNSITAYTKDTTSRTIRCQIIVDGTTVFDATSSAIVTTGAGMVPIGTIDGNGAIQQYGQIVYYTSFVVKVASSLSETDKVAVGSNYETWA